MSTFLSFLLFATLIATSTAQSTSPTPSPTGPINITAILEKGSQFTTFIKLLNTTQAGQQIENQLKNSPDGLTILAPTDNAFQTLKLGTINSLNISQQTQLVLYHILPKYVKFENFQTLSNPVTTLASNNDGKPFVLTVTYLGVNNVNISSGVVTTQINNALRDQQPLSVYQLDKVLLPVEIFGDTAAPTSPTAPKNGTADGPALGPSGDDGEAGKNGAYGVRSMGFGIIGVIGFVTMAIIF